MEIYKEINLKPNNSPSLQSLISYTVKLYNQFFLEFGPNPIKAQLPSTLTANGPMGLLQSGMGAYFLGFYFFSLGNLLNLRPHSIELYTYTEFM